MPSCSSPPLATIDSTSLPSGEPQAISSLTRAPVMMCGALMRMASCLAYVPLPTPGGPRKTTTGRRAFDEEDDDAKLVQSLRQVVSSRIFWCSGDELQQQTVHVVVLRAKFGSTSTDTDTEEETDSHAERQRDSKEF